MSVAFVQTPAGQIRVEEGFGRIVDLKLPAADRRNAQVIIDAEHLKEPVTGWADGLDNTLVAVLVAARASGARIRYRVETHRLRSIDPAIPFADLGTRDKVRDLVSLFTVDGDGVPLDANGLPVGLVVGAGPDPRHAAGAAPSESPDPAHTSSVATSGAPAAQPSPSTSQAAPRRSEEEPERRTSRPGVKIEEAKPWERYNTDGSLNLGSYAYGAAAGMVELAYDLLAGQSDAPPALPAVRALAGRLLEAADMAQAMTRDDARSDRLDNSHTRARGAIRTVIAHHPPPWGAAAPDVVPAWVVELAQAAADLLGVAKDLTEDRR